MKGRIQEIFLALLFGLGIPGVIFAVSIHPGPEDKPPVTTTEQAPSIADPESRKIRLLLRGEILELPVEEYLVGVLLQEMPESFSLEAKKAQATAARTYTLRSITLGVKHPVGTICADHTCCQAYISPEEYIDGGGDPQALEAARQAVEETAGQVVVYEGALIDATYFACSGGRTEDALAVWGADIPYLQSVPSPGEERAAHYTDTVQLSCQAFFDALGLPLSGSAAAWIGDIQYTQGGGVESLTVGGRVFTGVQLRSLLGLRSTAFTLTSLGDTVTITTRGYGHRVGMSQQGANAMALSGSSYREILAHYYTNTTVQDYEALAK